MTKIMQKRSKSNNSSLPAQAVTVELVVAQQYLTIAASQGIEQSRGDMHYT